MKVAELLEARRENWRELELLCTQLESRGKRRIGGAGILRFASLYRSACADLALADAYQLPQHTVNYLHHLVGRAHNQLYRSRKFNVGAWGEELFVRVPQRLLLDGCLWLAFFLFFGSFFLCMGMSFLSTEFAENIAGTGMLDMLEEMYSEPVSKRWSDDPGQGMSMSSVMAGYYVQHNTSIGLRVFVMGLGFGLLGLLETVYNACVLGCAFGYMASTPHRWNFFEFVTAHGPFELFAIVVSAAAGMRMGFALIHTQGFTRTASLARAARAAIPVMGMAMVLFALAAFIEGFISPSPLPWAAKGIVFAFSVFALVVYLVVLGWPRKGTRSGQGVR